MQHKLIFPYVNYKGEFSIRSIEPTKIGFQQKNLYHGENCFILNGYDHEKQAFREFCFDDILRGTIIHTLESMKIVVTEERVSGIMDKLKSNS